MSVTRVITQKSHWLRGRCPANAVSHSLLLRHPTPPHPAPPFRPAVNAQQLHFKRWTDLPLLPCHPPQPGRQPHPRRAQRHPQVVGGPARRRRAAQPPSSPPCSPSSSTTTSPCAPILLLLLLLLLFLNAACRATRRLGRLCPVGDGACGPGAIASRAVLRRWLVPAAAGGGSGGGGGGDGGCDVR